jgi:putative ABC transport system permease protein
MFNLRQFLVRSLAHHRRVHIAVALGVAAATAVLCGALLVGDSVRASLQHLVLDRFGRIDDVLVVDRFFRQELASELLTRSAWSSSEAAPHDALHESIVPAVLLMGGTVERAESSGSSETASSTDDSKLTGSASDSAAISASRAGARRATQVQILGVDAAFWDLSPATARRPTLPQGEQVVLNQPLADELGAKIGDTVVLRLPGANQVPADSPLGRKTDRIRSLAELKVVDIIPAEGLGRFSLRSTQRPTLTIFLPLELAQQAVEQTGRVNAMFAVRKPHSATPASSTDAIPVPADLADLGLKITRVEREFKSPEGGKSETVYAYFHLSSDRLLIDEQAARAAMEAWRDFSPQPTLTYLANTIAKVSPDATASAEAKTETTSAAGQSPSTRRPGIPYSMISAIDSNEALGPLRGDDGQPLPPLGDQEIALTSWAANDLGVKPGDKIRVTWFEPETTHGETRETSAEFTLRAIVPLVEPTQGYRRNRLPVFDKRPTEANDPDLTPTVEGVTDQESIDKWDPPFPYEPKRMRAQDDQYWSRHRTTPKAYVSAKTGARLWKSRFGSLTSIRVPARAGVTEDELRRRLFEQFAKDQVRLGMEWLPLKQRGLDASKGTTPFDALFLSLSFFVIGAALLLVGLLYRLGLERRAAEIGLLAAVGWSIRRITRALVIEGIIVAAVGAVIGVVAGLGYAWLMVTGLKTWWVGAISTPFLELAITPRSLLVGYASGVVVSALVTYFTLRALRKAPVRPLLAGTFTAEVANATGAGSSSRRDRSRWVLWALVVGTLASSGSAFGLSGEARAGAFVAGGMCLLGTLLMLVWRWFQRAGGMAHNTSRFNLPWLAARNAGRNPSRSTLTIGLVATACFLIVSMSAFRLQPTATGVGGFDLIAESAQPIFVDLNSPQAREDLWGEQASALQGVGIFAWRVQPGDDASCNNLYQATQPRVLGVSAAFVEDQDRVEGPRFGWAATAADNDATRKNPWRLLSTYVGQEPHDFSRGATAVPVVLDMNTALYSLHLYGGVGQEFEITYSDGQTIRFRVAGLLSNSVLQGSLMIDERQFTKLFPEVSGYRHFLVRTGESRAAAVAQQLEERLGDEGFDASDSRQVLAAFLSVQNTYLSTFQSLGALGLLLGTFGLATVQARSVFERRGELALLRATGFPQSRLNRLVLLEHAVLLLGGLTVGVVAALGAVLPHGALGSAPAPWGELSLWLACVLVVGLISGWIALRAMSRAPVIGALHGD